MVISSSSVVISVDSEKVIGTVCLLYERSSVWTETMYWFYSYTFEKLTNDESTTLILGTISHYDKDYV